jgi:hypothetical protein
VEQKGVFDCQNNVAKGLLIQFASWTGNVGHKALEQQQSGLH